MTFVGIDPGLSGAVAFLFDDGSASALDIPTYEFQAAKGKRWDEGVRIVEGCTPVSAGCAHCWELAMLRRYGWDGVVRFREDRLPRLSQGKPRVKAIWGDLFHQIVSDEDVERALVQMAVFGAKHTYVVLTKRPDRARRTVADWIARMPVDGPPKNIIFGTSAEDQATLDERVPHLLATPAAWRCVSLEPLLDRVNLRPAIAEWRCENCKQWEGFEVDLEEHDDRCPACGSDCFITLASDLDAVTGVRTPQLDWVVVGAETGAKRRPCKLEWIIDVVEQCRNAGVPCWVKAVDLGKRVSHDPAEWPAELTRLGEMRQWLQPETA